MLCNQSNEEKINVCIKCGNNDILINNCGYSSFNAGSGTCKKCENKVVASNGSRDDDNWIIKEWNFKNPTKEEEIVFLEDQIKKMKNKIKEVKKRDW